MHDSESPEISGFLFQKFTGIPKILENFLAKQFQGVFGESYGFEGFSGISEDSDLVRGSISRAEMTLKSPAVCAHLRDQSLGC